MSLTSDVWGNIDGLTRLDTALRDEQDSLGQKHNQSNLIPITSTLKIMKQYGWSVNVQGDDEAP